LIPLLQNNLYISEENVFLSDNTTIT